MTWIYKFRISLITTLAIILIVLAVSFSVLRAFLPHATGYVDEVEQAITSQTGLFVSIGSIDADMHWLTPRLKLLDVVAFDADGRNELIYFDEAIFSLALIDSLLKAELTLGEISLIGADIVIERYADANDSGERWVVQGIELTGDGSNVSAADGSKGVPEELIAVMKRMDFLLLDSDIHWIDHKNSRKPMDFVGVNVVSKAFLGRHSIGLEAQLPHDYGDAFRFVAEIGDLNDLNNLGAANWDIFLEGESVNIVNVLSSLDMQDIPETSGILDGKIWLNYRNKKISRVSGDVSINSFEISNGTPKRQWAADHLTSKFNVHQLNEGWRLDVTDLVLVKNGRIWGEISALTILSNQESGLRASATYLRLQDVLQIPAIFLDEEKTHEMESLKLAKVSGDIYNFEVILPFSEQSRPRAKGVFKDLNFTVPDTEIVVEGVDGLFRYEEDKANIELLSESVDVDFGQLFRQSIKIDAMDGMIAISQGEDGWLLESPNIHLANSDVKTDTRLKAIVTGDGAVIVDIESDFKEADVKSIKKYYPVPIMSDSLLDWLDNAFIDGMVDSGSFILHGDVSQFPYANYDGVMEVVFSPRDLTLHFLEGWPDLEDLTADIRFYNSNLSVENGTGKTYAGVMRQAKAIIPDLELPRLFLQGEITAPANDLQQYVWNSGLDEILGAALRQFRASGDVRLDLSLEVPLDDEEVNVETKGKLSFNNNKLYFPVMEYSLNDVTGELSFVGNDMTSPGLSASFEGVPLKINVMGTEGDASRGSVINIHGHLPIDGLMKKFDWMPVGWFKGASDWDISVRLPGSNDPYSIKVDMQSELNGVEINMSNALSKVVDEIRPVSVSLKTIDDILQTDVNMNGVMRLVAARDDANWEFFVDSRLIKGNGAFNENLHKDSTVHLNLEYVDLLTLLEKKKDGTAVTLLPTFFPALKVAVDTMVWEDWKFKNVRLRTMWQPQGMLVKKLNLEGPSFNVRGQGSWLTTWKKTHESSFKFNVNSADLGNTLSGLGFTDRLSQGKQTATVNWQWPAEPYGFSLSSVEGSSHFEVTDGRIKDLKPGAGGRLLGLPVQIFSGDFKNVYKEGFAFDSVKGDFRFKKGNAVTNNIEINAAPADIGLTGRIGIVKKDYDLVMLVRPKSGAATFTTGTLVGGPVIGTGLVLLKKLFGVDEMLHDEYMISGPWENPEVILTSEHDERAEESSDENGDE